MSHELTTLEKAALLSGENIWQSRAFPHADIRALFFADGPHGVRKQTGSGDHLGIAASQPATCFPTSATIANSWDTTLAQEVGEALGAEAASQEVDVLLGPGLNVKRSPLCGRNFEYFSEDPYLSGTLAAGYVRGIQSQGVAASPKHFAANSQELRRMASDSVVDERTLREIYLTGFEIMVRESSPRVVMSAYNQINGTYAHENAHLLKDILRDEWGFDGAVITDWGGGNDPVAAVRAGGGLEMPSPGLDSVPALLEALERGELSMEDLDARVEELRALGQWVDGSKARPADLDAHHRLARRAARESAVLLRNEDAVLPLAASTRVAVIGDFADTPRYQGAGSSLVNASQLTSPLEALRASDLDVVAYAPGFKRDGTADAALTEQAVDAAMGADVVLLYLGLDEVAESEGKDREHLRMHEAQTELLARLRSVNKRVVVVLSAGSVVEMPWIEDAAAVLHGYLGGQAGAEAMVELLTGKANPAGRLAETYPLTLDDTPTVNYYPGVGRNAEYREGLYVGYRYYATTGVDVRFPFGFGLSYTAFEYSDLSVTDAGATFNVTNTGDVAGAEVPQLYVSRKGGAVFRPALELKGFTKVALDPGETASVTIPFDQYTFRHFDVAADAWAVEAGEVQIIIGASSQDHRLTATHQVEGTDVEASDPALESYASGNVRDVSDAEFTRLLGRDPQVQASQFLRRNDPLRAMHEARSPLARVGARVLRSLIERSERKGKPDLNLYFLYNMPFRAMAKMTGGAVSSSMVDQMLRIVNGHFFRGAGGLIRAFFANQSTSRQLRRDLESSASVAAPQ
ncbi:glycoside hydrolase family 3 C-terminal domain-containing protein [Demequina sp. B12]|uniref:glycoside hydrolase family 3 C-terminal domain-containing protein n=1 Tax=Demequina sp. B12 TaxID=2992757 RepID=UPI00237BD9B6|nr:glycoside hydrolase family 3 C-terminal domain-containing protein [Demequina sp. B12]MDE0573605.1 glycoside hydrolase family 3 C-terminal domain-containing protein [Demequina sp. B12]